MMCKNHLDWDDVIADAERQVKEGQERIAELKYAIQTLTEMRDSGEPFPVESAKPSQSEAA